MNDVEPFLRFFRDVTVSDLEWLCGQRRDGTVVSGDVTTARHDVTV